MENSSKLDKTVVYLYNKPNLNHKKLAIFDIDWTLIKPKDGKEFPKDEDDWVWLRKSVPIELKKYSKTHQLVFLTDQSKSWKLTIIQNMVKDLNLSVVVLIALTKKYEKGNPDLFLSIFPNFNTHCLKNECFMVGYTGGAKNWSSVDADPAKKTWLRSAPSSRTLRIPRRSPGPFFEPQGILGAAEWCN